VVVAGPDSTAGYEASAILVHGAGGTVIIYRDLARHLGADQPIYGLQAQGLDGKQACLTSVEDMASHYLEAIRTIQPRGRMYWAVVIRGDSRVRDGAAT